MMIALRDIFHPMSGEHHLVEISLTFGYIGPRMGPSRIRIEDVPTAWSSPLRSAEIDRAKNEEVVYTEAAQRREQRDGTRPSRQFSSRSQLGGQTKTGKLSYKCVFVLCY